MGGAGGHCCVFGIAIEINNAIQHRKLALFIRIDTLAVGRGERERMVSYFTSVVILVVADCGKTTHACGGKKDGGWQFYMLPKFHRSLGDKVQ